MKKFYSFLIAAVALVGFAACESNEEAATPEAETMTFVASFADETRTALADANGNVEWCADDTILVTNGVTTKTFTATSVDGATATFTGERMDGETFYAIYGGEDATFANDEWTYTVSATQTAKKGTFADGAAVSTAVCTDGKTLAFENQCAVLKFQVPTDASTVEFFNGSTSVVKVTGTMKTGEVYYATVKPADYKFTVRINGYISKESTKTLSVAANTIYNLGELPLEKYEWGIVGQHQGWTITNPDALYKVADNVYARFNVSLESNGFKFAKHGLQNWNTKNTSFGAWKKSEGKEFFNFSTEMGVGAWYGVYTNNLGGQSENIGVSNFNNKYDIYVKVINDADWGQELGYTVVTAGSTVTF
jgi:hypothetical protein